MSRGQHAAGDRSFNRSAGGAMARGVALIVAAVILGVVLLRQTDEPGTTTVATKDTTTTTEADAADGATTTSTAAATAARNPAQVTVLVANGSGVQGAATKTAATLKAASYLTATPVNTTSVVPSSTVYYVPGYELDAKAVVALLKPTPKVAAMPSPLPVANLAGAQVLVVVAGDLARA